MLQELRLKEDSEIPGILGVLILHWKYTGKSCTGRDHSCHPSNGLSSDMLFLGVSLAVKRSSASHVSAASCGKGWWRFSSCISPGGTWRLCNMHSSVLWLQGCSLPVSISSSNPRQAKPDPDSASTAWPHPHSYTLQLSKTGWPHGNVLTCTGSAATSQKPARDSPVNPAAQTAAFQRQCQCTGASPDIATLSKTNFPTKPTGKGDCHSLT